MTKTRWGNQQGQDIEGQTFDVVDLPIIALTVVRGMLQALTSGANVLDYVLRAHANHRRNQREFHNDVRDTIERI